MGAAALSCYRQTLAERWQATKQAIRDEQLRRAERIAAVAHQPRKVQKIHYEHQDRSTERLLTTLESLHLRQLKLGGDEDGVIAVLRENLDTPTGFSKLIQALEEAHRFADALAEAKAAHQGVSSFSVQ